MYINKSLLILTLNFTIMFDKKTNDLIFLNPKTLAYLNRCFDILEEFEKKETTRLAMPDYKYNPVITLRLGYSVSYTRENGCVKYKINVSEETKK